MKKNRLVSGVAIALALNLLVPTMLPTAQAASSVSGQNAAQSQHQIPVLKVTPSTGATTVRPDVLIQITLDAQAATFSRFQQQFVKGAYQVYLNGALTPCQYDDTTHTITLMNPLLTRYTTYQINLVAKADLQNDRNQAGNATYSFAFQTGSALHEATHLSAHVEKQQVRVTESGKLLVQVTDDYGQPADNATVKVNSDSPHLQATELTVGAGNKGQGVIELTDHVKETASLTVTAQDRTTSVTQSVQTKEQFVAGPAHHMTLQAPATLTAGKSGDVSGIIYDVYDNQVEDGSFVTLATSAGSAEPVQAATLNGTFGFRYHAPTRSQAVIVTAQSEQATASATIQVLPDQPAQITCNSPQISMTEGETQQVLLTVTDAGGNAIPNAALTVQSTGGVTVPSTVTTDASGQAVLSVVGNQAGQGTLTVNTTNGVSAVLGYTINSSERFETGLKGWIQDNTRKFIYHEDGTIEQSEPGTLGSLYHPISTTLDSATFEITAKVLVNNGYHGLNSAVILRTGTTGMIVSILPDRVEVYDSPTAAALFKKTIDGNNYHTYRLVKEKNQGTLYIDGNFVFSTTLREGTNYQQSRIQFGDCTSYPDHDVLAYYKSIKLATGNTYYLTH